jgi:FkbM family methyltransferase
MTSMAASVFRVAPWALAAAQTGLLHLLLGRYDRTLLESAVLARRRARVEWELDDLAWGPASLDPRRVPAGTPDDAIVYRTVTLRNGVWFEVALDPRHMDPIADAVMAGDTWFLDDYYVLLDLLKPGDTVLDLGTHIGTFALAAAALGCRVLCVEAGPRHVRLVEASIARNEFDGARVMHGAVADREGSIEFLPSGPWGTIANPAVESSPAMIQARTLAPVTVPAVTVDALLDRLGWDHVDAVKLDVEGAEAAALRGMAGLLSRPDAPMLLYESNSHTLQFFGNTRADLESALERYGYTSYSVEPGRLIPTQPGELEPQSCINCLAVRGRPPEIAGWHVTEPRSLDETIRRVVGQSGSPRAFDRAYVAHVLADADTAIQTDPRVGLVLRRLCRDADESVRLAAAWSLSSDELAPRGAQGWP